jgi:hypothetical protein
MKSRLGNTGIAQSAAYNAFMISKSEPEPLKEGDIV